MTEKHRISFTKLERSQKRAAERLLADPSALPSHRATALRTLKRVQAAAEDRAFDRALADEPDEPTVEDLVSALEKAEKQPPQPIENKGTEKAPNAINAVLAPSEPAKASEVTQTAPEPPTAFCGFCSAAGQWNTRFPVGQADGVILCPVCFSKMCAADMRQTAAAALARQQTPPDWAGDFAAQRNINSSDFEKSRAIWAEQDRENADRQDQERIERARLEGQYNAARARWIQDGGKL